MSSSWLAAAALTFASSIHCVGMCGGFVAAVGGGGRTVRALCADQLLLQVGKAASYAFLGATAGLFGSALIESAGFAGASRGLAILAGLAIVLAGLTLLGVRRGSSDRFARWAAPLWGRVMQPLLALRPQGFPLVVGMAMGFLPCPLVYAGLAAAAASGSPAVGAALLAGVALGTVPALTFVAFSGALLGSVARRRLALAGGLGLVLVGALTIARGVFPAHDHSAPAPSGAPHHH